MVLLPEASEHLLGTPWAPSPRRKLMPPPVPGELNDGTACAGPRIRVPDCALCPGPRIPDRLWRRVPWAVIGGGAHATSHAKIRTCIRILASALFRMGKSGVCS